ncbi:MAG: SEC-C domain-containing protein [Melioribacteraceae bacterium]|nr:SEC-C domain-containing protein [Melioribacteraceae bacterium]
MGPTIILDKSSLQALSKKELILLNKLYLVNIPPVLTIEILADLKKTDDPNALNENGVIEISNKLIQKDNAVNVHYLNSVISSLMGVDYLDCRCPQIGGAKKVKDQNGKIGFQVIESPEQAAIKNWQRGDFSEAEKILATQWRAYSREINLEELKNNWLSIKNIFPECKYFKTLLMIVDFWLDNPSMQSQLLFLMLEHLRLEQKYSTSIFYRWESGNDELLKTFAPYFHFITKIDTAFRLGLVYNLITTRPTNRIDCEYLYYIPFCNIFSSRDNFHKSFAPHFLAEDQVFIDGDELKSDLNNIIDLLEKEDSYLQIDWDIQFSIEPPNDENSFTFKMWKKYYPSWSPGWFYKKSDFPQKDSKTSQEINDRVNTFEEIEFDPFEKFNDDEIDFISIEKHISLEDQCVCGSGKKFKECCYKEGMKPDA